jgi:uncharacterized protein
MQSANHPAAAIVALSTAKPRRIDMNGRQVNSAIVRAPSSEPLRVVEGGLADNEPAVHTEHVLVMPAEHYDYWTERLEIPRDSWDWCWWGENLTVTGLSEEDLHIGDILSIGTARFRVTSPRIPCFKVAWRVGQPDSILPQMMETGRVGFHLKVFEPGIVRISDTPVVVKQNAEAITVADLSRLLLSQAPEDLGRLQAVLDLPALGLKAQNAVRQRINLIEDKERLQIGRWRGWRPFTVEAVEEEALDIRSFWLVPEDGAPIAPPAAGQFLTVRPELDRAEAPITRPWTISGLDLDRNAYRVSVRKLEGGLASGAMHDFMGPGGRIHLRPPAGQFTLDRSGFRRIAFISGGIGVTPLLAMLKAYVGMGDHAPPALWVQVVRNGAAHAFRDEIARLLAAAPKVKRIVWYTDPGSEDVRGRDFDRAGRPTETDIAEIFGGKYPVSPFGKEIEIPGTETEVYLCGPKGLETLARSALDGLGMRPGLINSETFVTPDTEAPSGIETATVTFAKSGIVAQWHVDDGLSLLDLAESVGLEPPFACRSGVCQSCSCRISGGGVAHSPTPATSPEPGSVLLCCARPATDAVTLDL